MSASSNKIEIFTDGACKGNPGPGGWGAIIRENGQDLEIKGAEKETTNNIMELTAAIAALNRLPSRSEVILITDSQYLVKGMTEWLRGWIKKNWRTASRQPVKNKPLWQELDRLNRLHSISWVWTRGHSGHPENERADQLANEAIEEAF